MNKLRKSKLPVLYLALLIVLSVLLSFSSLITARADGQAENSSANQTTPEILITSVSPVDSWSNSSTADFVYDVESSVQLDNCSLIVDGNPVATDYSIYNLQQNTFSQHPVSEGMHEWKVQCSYQDLSNGTMTYAAESELSEMYADLTPPSISILYPLNDSIYLINESFGISYSAYDNFAIEIYCSIYIDGVQEEEDIQIQNSTQALYLTDFSRGTHTVEMTCTDFAENSKTEKVQFEIIDLEIATNKNTYSIGEDVNITVTAPNSSNLSLIISWNNGNSQLTPTNLNNIYPLTYKFLDAEKVDTYKINATILYKGRVVSKSLNFNVINSMLVSIYSASTANLSQLIDFSGIALNGISPYTYSWNFGDGSTGTGQNINHAYSSTGNFLVALTAKDALNNEKNITKTVTITQSYSLKVTVKENNTDTLLEDAKIVFGDLTLYTNSSGKIIANVLKGNYIIHISKSGYSSYTEEYNFTENKEIAIYLNKYDEDDPKIQLITPPNNSLEINPMIFTFKAFDEELMNCSLYYSEYSDSNWWTEYGNINASNGQEKSFTLENMDPGEYKWKIECIDKRGNSNFSETYFFTLENSENLAQLTQIENSQTSYDETPGDLYGLISAVDETSLAFEKYTNEQKSIIETLKLKEKLNEIRRELEQANRDLFNLDKKGLSDAEMLDQRDIILENIELLKQQIPRSVEIVQSNEFIKYPTSEDLKEVASNYLSAAKTSPTNKEIDQFAKQLKEMQSVVSVSTKAVLLKVSYLSGDKKDYMIIQRTFDVNKTYSNLSVIECIPKDIIDSAEKIFFLNDVEIIKDDPVVKIIPENNKISYVINSSFGIEKVPKIKSAVLIGDFREKNSFAGISGLLIFRNYNLGIDLRLLLIEITAIIILGSIYFMYSFKGRSKKKTSIAKEMKENQYIFTLIDDALESLKLNDLEKTAIIYTEIELIYNNLAKDKKDEIYPRIVDLCNEINLHYISVLVSKSDELISENKMPEANQVYREIQEIYNLLDDKHREMVHEKCIEIHDSLYKNTNAEQVV